MSWIASWKRWSRVNKLTAAAAVIAIILGIFQALQMSHGAYVWIDRKVHGPPPLTIPLRQIHAGMLDEIEYNIDCLSSFDALRYGDVEYEMCEPKTIYTNNWFLHIAVLKSRDYYSESLYTKSDWENAKEFYGKIIGLKNKSDFLKVEKESKITLRDAIFLTGYIRYFYKNFYEVELPDKCSEEVFENKISGDCKKQYDRLYGDEQAWQEQIEKLSDMPTKYVVYEGKPIRRYVEWLSIHD